MIKMKFPPDYAYYEYITWMKPHPCLSGIYDMDKSLL
jgi:hypothetical protein